MNREDLQKLAEERLADAKVLSANGRASGAYYLGGYVIECALKACIAKLTRAEDFPMKDSTNKVYIHNLEKLASVSRFSFVIEDTSKTDPEFRENWAVVCKWTEESRYESHSEQEAERMLAAVSDPNHGVLQCIRRYW